MQIAEEDLAKDALEKLKPLLKPEKMNEARTIVARIVTKSHSGPIPSAEELGHLEAVLPGAADRVITMAEREQEHRHTATNSIVDKEFAYRGRGQIITILALTLILLAVGGIAWLGDTKSAAALGSVTIVAVVTAIIRAKVIDSHEESNDQRRHENAPRSGVDQKSLPKPRQPKRR